MMIFLLIFIGLAEAAGTVWFLWKNFYVVSRDKKATCSGYDEALKQRQELLVKMQDFENQVVPATELRKKGDEYQKLNDLIKAERGRLSLTQAELDTVENHSRELDVIGEELEASAQETQDEISILEKKRDELLKKTNSLNKELEESDNKISNVMAQLQLSVENKEKIENMRRDLLDTQRKCDELLEKIKVSQEQYIKLKRRYDALDIEYAQLYEKFSFSN